MSYDSDGIPDVVVYDGANRRQNLEERKWRDLVAFWFLGLCNNYAYVVMLTAAEDILHEQEGNSTQPTNHTLEFLEEFGSNATKKFPHCNPIGTGAILLADIIPTLIIKLSAPFFMHRIPYDIRVAIVILFAAASFLIVAFSPAVWVSFLGVVCASISSGFGEITFLSLSSHFNLNVVSTYSSGTGGAGVFGALSYAGLRQIGVSARNTLFIMLVVPTILTVSYYFLLDRPDHVRGVFKKCRRIDQYQMGDENQTLVPESDDQATLFKHYSLKHKLSLVTPLLKYMIPLALVYTSEYFINQALYELLYFKNAWLTQAQQYKWYQVDYQVGVFISRSSINILPIHKLWILPILQWANVVLLIFQAFYSFIPSIWIMFAIILYEGLLGGAAYVNTFYKIRKEVEPAHKEFSLGVASVADTLGICIAGTFSIPTHNYLCGLPA